MVSLFRRSAPSVLSVSAAAPHEGGSLIEKAKAIVGSAFVWDEQHVVTSLGVLEAANTGTPYLTFPSRGLNGEEHRASIQGEVVGADPLSRIAVVRVDGAPEGLMRPLRRGSSEELRVGQDVYAIGSPYGLERSLSRGVVSGLARTLPAADGMVPGVIQVGGSLGPGFSGGPLLDSSGAAVGVTASSLPLGAFIGMGMAIPIEAVQRHVADVIEKGFVTRPWLGAVFAPDQITQDLVGLGGAMVLQVVPGGPADEAGLRPMHGGYFGDVITRVAGSRVESTQAVLRILEQRNPGESVVMLVRRPNLVALGASASGGDSDTAEEDFEELEVTVRLGKTSSKLVLT